MAIKKQNEYDLKVQDDRVDYAINKLSEIEAEFTVLDKSTIEIIQNGNSIIFFPYTGWHTGKGIKDGRGIQNLIKQLK